MIVWCHVFSYCKLCIYIVLHFVTIPVQMIGSDIEQNGHIGLKAFNIIELEATNLQHPIFPVALSEQSCEAFAHITCGYYILSRFRENVMRKQRSSGLAICTRYGDYFPGCRSEEHTSELQSRPHLVCRLLLEKKKKKNNRSLKA